MKNKKQRDLALTDREQTILNMLYEGLQSQTIADILVISKRTVDFHIANMYEKLDVHNRISAMKTAIRLGFLKPLDELI